MVKLINNHNSEKFYKKDILFWSGVSGVLIAAGYLLITAAFTISGFPLPNDGLSWIAYLDGKVGIWQFIIWASILTNILYIIFAFGFLKFFEDQYKFLVTLGSILFTLFVVLELAGTWSAYPTILELYKRYSASGSAQQRLIYINAIEYTSIHFQTTANAFFTIVLPSFAAILFSLAMLKSKAFGKLLPLIGLVSGFCNMTSVFGGLVYEPLKKLVMIGSFLVLFWFAGIGIKFIKLSRK